MLEAQLPEGLTRNQHCLPHVSLDTCHAMCFAFQRDDGSESELIVWRDGVVNIKPAQHKQRLRDLRPGEADFDAVDRDACLRTILGVDDSFPYEILKIEDWIGRRLVADGFLSVDGRLIYRMMGFAVGIV